MPLSTWMLRNTCSVASGWAGGGCCADTRTDIATSRPTIAAVVAHRMGRAHPSFMAAYIPHPGLSGKSFRGRFRAPRCMMRVQRFLRASVSPWLVSMVVAVAASDQLVLGQHDVRDVADGTLIRAGLPSRATAKTALSAALSTTRHPQWIDIPSG